jgi:hypothetical protein
MLNDVYKKVEEEKKNEIKSSKISMSREEFISEHKNLIKVLRSGDKKAQEAEAARQEAELKKETGEKEEEEEEDEDEEEDDEEDND